MVFTNFTDKKKNFFTCTIKIDEIKEDNINWQEFLKLAIKVILRAAKYNKIDKKKKTYSAVFQECNKRRGGLACSQFLFELSRPGAESNSISKQTQIKLNLFVSFIKKYIFYIFVSSLV